MTSNNTKNPKIGDVYLMKFNGCGSEQNGWRPGVVFQNNVGNYWSPNIIALPLTSSIKKKLLPTHVFIDSSNTDLIRDSIVLCENPERMSKERLGNYITSLPSEYMVKIAKGSLIATSAIAFLEIDDVIDVWEEALFISSKVVPS